MSPELIAMAVAIALTWPSPPPAPAPAAVDGWRWEGHQAMLGVRATQAGSTWS